MSLKILLADDSMTAQKLGQKILTDAGHEVIAVSNGAAAVKRIAEHKPDLLLLDVFMPGNMNGLQLCKYLKENRLTHAIPIILLTQYNSKESTQFGLKLGAIEYIPKDAFSDAVLLETLRAKGLINEAAAEM